MKSHQRGFRLTEGDIEIIKWVYQCRLVTIDHLIALIGRARRKLNGRLVRLTERGYLYRRRGNTYEKYIYTINQNAAPILVERGVAPKELIDARVRFNELTDLFLRHALMITDIHTTLEVACRASHITFHDWREGRELYDNVNFSEDGKRIKLPVRPDAFFTLEDTRRPEGRNRAHFFLEADRSTTTHKRFQKKLNAYSQYYAQKLHTQKYGIKNFRVLTLTLTESRAENLCEAASKVLPQGVSKFYYFTPVSHFSLSNPSQIFDNILMTPRDFQSGRRYHLIPPLEPNPAPAYAKEGAFTPATPSRDALRERDFIRAT